MSYRLFSHSLPESEREQDFGRYGLKPGTSASPLPFKRRGLRRTIYVKRTGDRIQPLRTDTGKPLLDWLGFG